MTFAAAVAELKGKYPKANISLSVLSGSGFERAAHIEFRKGKNGVYAGKDTSGTEVFVYYNDTEHTISCTEIGPDGG